MSSESSGSHYRRLWIRWFLVLTGLTVVVVAYPLALVSPLHRNSVLLGWLISLVLGTASGLLAFWAIARSMKSFMLIALGGMIGRLALFGVAVVLAALAAGVHVTAFLIGLLGSYVVYQILELVVLHVGASQSSGARS